MSFNFNSAMKQAKQDMEQDNKLGLMLLAPSGGGKSTAIGTLGVKTLYLYTLAEDHGPSNATIKGGKNVVPVCLDYVDGQKLNAGQALKRLFEILGSGEEIKKEGFKAIAIDGLTELEAIVKQSPTFNNLVGGNKFKEVDVAIDMISSILLKLKQLQREIGIHYVVTCILDVKEMSDNGEIMDSQPRVVGYRVADNAVQMFGDVVVVGPMSNGDTVQHRLQFAAGVSKTQKELSGAIKKTTNYRPRLRGVDLSKVLPDHGTLEVDLSKLIEMKQGNK